MGIQKIFLNFLLAYFSTKSKDNFPAYQNPSDYSQATAPPIA